jgi:hypothetical protein
MEIYPSADGTSRREAIDKLSRRWQARSRGGSGGPDSRRRAEQAQDEKDAHAAENEDPRQVLRHDRGEDTADR